jgi:hypothetical protein
MTPGGADPVDAARAALAGGEPVQAVRQIRLLLGYPAGIAVPAERAAEALAVLADAAAASDHGALAEASRRLAADIDDPDRMYDLGYQLIEDGLPAIAATVLRRCYDAVGDSEQVITELVAALEGMMAYRDAAGFLRDLPLLGDSFLCRYLYAFNATLAGDLAVARMMHPKLVPEDRDQEVMAARIAGFIARADLLAGVTPLDERDLRGWHHVVTGGVLTHLSPFGYDEPMRGRYAWLQDSAQRIVTGVTRLARVLAAWGIAPPCVYAPPGPGHDIVAALVATRFALPLAPWPAVGVPAPGIIVVYDLATIDPREVPRLLDIRPDQILYAHASPWAVDGPIAADVTTVLCQTLRPPWGPRLTVAGGGEVRTTAPDPRGASEIAAELALAGELGDDDTAVDDLAGLDRLVAAVGPPSGTRRERLWAGSPVASNHFD